MAAALHAHQEVEFVLERKGSNTTQKMMWNTYSTTVDGRYIKTLTTSSSIIITEPSLCRAWYYHNYQIMSDNYIIINYYH